MAVILALALSLTTPVVIPMLERTSVGDALENARRLVQSGEFSRAESMLRTNIAAHPSDADSHYLLAYSLLREGKAVESLNEYSKAAEQRAPSAVDLRNVGLDYVLLTDLYDADLWLSKALSMNDSDPETLYAVCRLRYTQGRAQDAIVCFRKVLVFDSRNIKAEVGLGLAYEALGQQDEAIRTYRTAIDWQRGSTPTNAQPFLNLGIVLFHRDQLAEAQHLMERAVDIAPHDPRGRENLGQVYLRADRVADAVAQFAAAVQLSPRNPRFHYLLGRAYQRQGDHTRSSRELARSSALLGAHSTSDLEPIQ